MAFLLAVTAVLPLACNDEENEAPPELSVSTTAPATVVRQKKVEPEKAADTPDEAIPAAEAIETISWEAAANHIDEEVLAIGRIVKTGQSKTGHVFLNFDKRDQNTLTLFIHRDSVANFSEPPQKTYRDKLVRVHGFVYDYDGKPNLSVKSPTDITILPNDTPLPEPAGGGSPAPASRPQPTGTVKLATYNVLNLFDSFDDPYSADAPSDRKPRAELEAVARNIRKLDADVLALQEVENRGYLQRFVNAFLRDMGYEVVAFEGNDNRGIDCAVLSRLPVGAVTSHRHVRFEDPNGKTMRFRRDLLDVRIEPPGALPFDIFVIHLKSKGGEEEGGADTRMGEAAAIQRILAERLKQDPKAAFVVCGDFNDTIDSKPVQAILGGGDGALTAFVKDLPEDGRVSYNQEPYLSMIDFVFASPAMAARYVPGSYRIVAGGSPETTGSDHNPVAVSFKLD